jgi:hypothetical protein
LGKLSRVFSSIFERNNQSPGPFSPTAPKLQRRRSLQLLSLDNEWKAF